MEKYKIVIDTNVILSALRSSRRASFRLLSIIGSRLFEFSLSVPLFMEYESVAKRNKMGTLGLRLPDSLHEQIRKLAEQDGISINQFVSSAVAEKCPR